MVSPAVQAVGLAAGGQVIQCSDALVHGTQVGRNAAPSMCVSPGEDSAGGGGRGR